MPTITLKNIPDRLYERLKLLAKIRHRSLNSEIIFNLEQAVGLAEEDPGQLRRQTEAFRERLLLKLTSREVDQTITPGPL